MKFLKLQIQKIRPKSTLLRGLTKIMEELTKRHCNISFSQKGNLTRHVSIAHEKQKNFLCKKCNLEFREKSNLTKHNKAVHLKKKDNICEYCNQTFSLKINRDRHEKEVHCPKRLLSVRIVRNHSSARQTSLNT